MEISSQSTTSILADIHLNELPPEEQIEQGLVVPQQDASMPDLAPARGFLNFEGKFYVMQEVGDPRLLNSLQQEISTLVDFKLSEEKAYISFLTTTDKKSFDKNNILDKKEIKIVPETHLNKAPQNEAEQVGRTNFAVQRIVTFKSVKEAHVPSRQSEIKDKGIHAKREESSRKIEKEQLNRADKPQVRDREDGEEKNAKVVREKQEEKSFKDQQEKKRQNQDDDERDDQQQERPHKEPTPENELIRFAAEESSLSSILNYKITHFDVLLLFIEILKLTLRGREQERVSRWQEREQQIMHMEEVVNNLRQQSNYLFYAGIGSGALSIIAGAAPIAGYMKGDTIVQHIARVPFLNSLADMKQKQFFEGVSKMTSAMSDMYKTTGEMQRTYLESGRTRDQHRSELHKTDADENTRMLQEIIDFFKNLENFLHESLRMRYETMKHISGG